MRVRNHPKSSSLYLLRVLLFLLVGGVILVVFQLGDFSSKDSLYGRMLPLGILIAAVGVAVVIYKIMIYLGVFPVVYARKTRGNQWVVGSLFMHVRGAGVLVSLAEESSLSSTPRRDGVDRVSGAQVTYSWGLRRSKRDWSELARVEAPVTADELAQWELWIKKQVSENN